MAMENRAMARQCVVLFNILRFSINVRLVLLLLCFEVMRNKKDVGGGGERSNLPKCPISNIQPIWGRRALFFDEPLGRR